MNSGLMTASFLLLPLQAKLGTNVAHHGEAFPAADHTDALTLVGHPLMPAGGCCWRDKLRWGLTLWEAPLPWTGGMYSGDTWESDPK